MLSRRSLIIAAPAIIAAKSSIAQIGAPQIGQDNRLAFPSNRAPGFDPTNVGAAAAPTAAGNQIFSAVPIGASYFNLTANIRPASTGTAPTATVDAKFGPADKFAAGSIDFTGAFHAVTPTAATLAGFVLTTSSANQYFIAIGTAGGGPALNYSAGTLFWNNWGGSNPVTNLPGVAVVGTPYFYIGSSNAATVNFLALNLNTGKILTATGAGATLTANNTVARIGAANSATPGTNPVIGNIGPVMASLGFMSMTQMKSWAADPWSFWYPITMPLSDGI